MAVGTVVYLMSCSFHGIVSWQTVNKCASIYIFGVCLLNLCLFLFCSMSAVHKLSLSITGRL
jgi:hypothetical protein